MTRRPPPDRVQPLLDATADGPGRRTRSCGSSRSAGRRSVRRCDDTLGKDFDRAELLSLPVTLVILIVAFGALIAAGVPVLLALSSVAAAMGLSALASHLVPATDTTTSVILLIGMAVGVDYSLFYVRREREERAKGRVRLDAVEIAAATSGHAVVVSGFAVIISMAGLFLANDAIFSSLAVGSILVVAVAVLGSLTVLPALLAKLGRWVDRPRVPLLWRLTAPRRPAGQPAPVLAGGAAAGAAAPLVTLVVSVGLLLALAAPALGMKLKLPGMDDLPRDHAGHAGVRPAHRGVPEQRHHPRVVVRAAAEQADQVRAALIDLAERAAVDPLFAPPAGRPEIDVSADGRVPVLSVATPYASRTDEATRSLRVLRDDLVPATVGGSPAWSTPSAVTSPAADYSAHVRTSCRWWSASCWC